MNRFDDLVRTERYYSATLLPAILFHQMDQTQSGLNAFLRLVSSSVQSAGKSRIDWLPPPVLQNDEIEVITEFHIARDLIHAQLPLGETETSKKDAPDLVIIVGGHLLVCETKFFTKYSPKELNPQFRSQRQQSNHLFKNRPDLKDSYWHIAILPVKYDGDYDCDAVITWDEIADLSANVLGAGHYVTRRFNNALEKYRIEFADPAISAGKNFDGIADLTRVLRLCRERGTDVQVGHVGGIHDLERRDIGYMIRKPWKWRDPQTNLGRVIDANWIGGGEFVLIEKNLRQRN